MRKEWKSELTDRGGRRAEVELELESEFRFDWFARRRWDVEFRISGVGR